MNETTESDLYGASSLYGCGDIIYYLHDGSEASSKELVLLNWYGLQKFWFELTRG